MISKIFDYIERKTKAQADIDKMYELRAKEIEANKLQFEHRKLLMQQQTLAAMANTLPYSNQQGIQSVGINSGAGFVSNAVSPVVQATTVLPGTSYYTITPLTGILIDVNFTEADGSTTVLRIDSAYLDIMTHIGWGHQRYASSKKIMPELDFDLDEIEEASKLMESLNENAEGQKESAA